MPGSGLPLAGAHAFIGNAAIARSLLEPVPAEPDAAVRPPAGGDHAPAVDHAPEGPAHATPPGGGAAPQTNAPAADGAAIEGSIEAEAGPGAPAAKGPGAKPGAPAKPVAPPKAAAAAVKETAAAAPEGPAPAIPAGPIAPESVVDAIDVPASQAMAAVVAAKDGAKQGFDAERKEMAANPPSVERPSGMPRKEAPAKADLDATGPAKEKGAADKTEGGSQKKPDTTHVAATGPLPAPKPEFMEGLFAQPDDAAASAAEVEGAIDQVPESDESVNTDPGPAPVVVLDKEADPNNMQKDIAAHQPAIDDHWKDAHAGIAATYGENDVRPVVPKETLKGRAGTGVSSVKLSKRKPGELPPDAAAAFDKAGAEKWGAAVADAKAKDAAGKADREKGDADARAEADAEIARLKDEATKDQLESVAKGKEEVAAAKAGWTGELQSADGAYADKKTVALKDANAKIDGEKKKTDDDAKAQYEQAKKDADAEKKKSEDEAAAEKKKKKSGGVLGWIKRKVKDAINALKKLVKAIFDKLRKLVKGIIEKVKKAVVWAIEQCRKAIVGFLHEFEAVLDAAVDVFLDAFPEAKKKAKEWIHKGISTAENAVNKAADWLKKGVEKALDALGKALDWYLALYEKVIDAVLDVIEFIAVGLIEIIEGIIRLGESAAMVGDFFLGQMEEELIGMNLEEPLPIEKKGDTKPKDAADSAIASGKMSPADAKLFQGGLGDADVQVDHVAKMELAPELIRSLKLEEGKDVPLPGAAGPEGTVDALRAAAVGVPGPATAVTAEGAGAGTAPGAPGAAPDVASMTPDQQLEYLDKQPIPESCEAKKTEEPAKGDATVPDSLRVYGPFTRGQRASYMWSQIKKGVKQWWHCNWKKIVAIFAVAALIALLLGILTGGAIFAAIPPLLELIANILIGVAVVRAGLWVKDYLALAWAGDLAGGAKALARGFAILIIELVFALLFNIQDVIKAAKGGLKGIEEGAAKAAKGAIKETLEAASKLKSAVKASWEAGVENGRFILKGFEEGIGQGIKNVGELTLKFLKKFPFRGFFFRLKGRTLQLWGIINPAVLLATMGLTKEEVEEGLAAAHAAGKPIGEEARTAAKQLAEDLGEFAKTAKPGQALPRKISKQIKQLLSDIREQLLGENKVMQRMWEAAAKEVANGESAVAKFLDAAGKIKAGTSAKDAAETYAKIQATLSKRLPEYMDQLEKIYGPLARRLDSLPAGVQLHHLLPKSLYPELAAEAKNLVLALRKAGREAPDELHDLLHWIGAGALKAGGRTRWTTYRPEALDLIRKWLGL